MPQGLNIPIRAEGANEAAAQIERVTQGVRALGQAQAGGGNAGAAAMTAYGMSAPPAATQAAAQATGELARNTASAAQAQALNERAVTAVTGVLGRFSPELAAFVNVLAQVGKGAAQVTGTLLAFAGVGVVITAVVSAFQAAGEAARRAAEQMKAYADAQRRDRDAQLDLQEKARQRLETAGVFGGAQAAAAQAIDLMQRGTPEEQAIELAVAEQVTAAEGRELTPREKKAIQASGALYGGIEYSREAWKNRVAIKRAIERGGTPEAQAALEASLADRSHEVRRAAPAFPAATEQELNEDTLVEQLRATGQFDKADLEYARRAFRGEPLINEHRLYRRLSEDPTSRKPTAMERKAVEDELRYTKIPGGQLSYGFVREAVEMMKESRRDRPTTQPVVINQISVDTVITEPPGVRRERLGVDAPEQLVGGGIE